MQTFLAFDEGDFLRTPGIDWGNKNQPQILFRHKTLVVFKVKGSTQWCSRGASMYYGTQYVLAKLKQQKDGRVKVELIETRFPGNKWRQALNELIGKTKS